MIHFHVVIVNIKVCSFAKQSFSVFVLSKMAFLPFLNVVHNGIKADLPILVVILIGDVPNVTKKGTKLGMAHFVTDKKYFAKVRISKTIAQE